MNDEERILELDRHHLKRHTIRVKSEEDDKVFFPRVRRVEGMWAIPYDVDRPIPSDAVSRG